LQNNSHIKSGVGIRSTSDYSGFGVLLDGRTSENEGYRYGFNSMEKDDEIKGTGNSYDFGARMYDARVGRFMLTDAYEIKYPNNSPYIISGNSVLMAIDRNGNDIYIVIGKAVNSETGLIEPVLVKVTSENISAYALYDASSAMKRTMETSLGAELINEYMNSSTSDVYVSYQSIHNELSGHEGSTLNVIHFSPVNEDGVVDMDLIPFDNTYRKSDWKYNFQGLEVKDKNKTNHFVVLNNQSLKNIGDIGAEILFHEFMHVKYFDNGVKGDEHHEEMGSHGLSDGNNPDKIIPQFRNELKAKEKRQQDQNKE
jgi:RHS repeat-associated protein